LRLIDIFVGGLQATLKRLNIGNLVSTSGIVIHTSLRMTEI